jgi:predicted trehalose synthase
VASFGTRLALVKAWQRTGRHTLRITIEQSGNAALLTLEGRIAGAWAAELGRVWVDSASQLTGHKLSINLSNVIFADAEGMKVLRDIYAQAHPELVASTPWTRHLASKIAANTGDIPNQEQKDADNE